MKSERGATLVEVMGVLAIGGVMAAAAISTYTIMHNNQVRKIAASQLSQVVDDTKMLLEMRGDYTGLSIDYLIRAGALKSEKPPIGTAWEIAPTFDGAGFTIKLDGLTHGECEYFVVTNNSWATSVTVNGFDVTDGTSQCFTSQVNQITFNVE